MEHPRRFLLYVVLAALAAWAVGAGVLLRLQTPDLQALLKMVSTHRASLAARDASAPRSRVLFAGGSGTSFGMSAATFEAATGRFSYNLGTHAGAGITGVAAIALTFSRSGDTVVLAPEYPMLDDARGLGALTIPLLGNLGTPFIFADRRDDILRRIALLGSPGLQIAIAGAGSRLLGMSPPNAGYAFDARGDLVDFPKTVPVSTAMPGKVSDAAASVLRSLGEGLRARGARLLLVLPFAHVPAARLTEARALAGDLSRELERFAPVLHSETGEVSADPAEFSNTLYHASPAGRAARTERIIASFADAERRLGPSPD